MDNYTHLFDSLAKVMNYLAPRATAPLVERADANNERMHVRHILNNNANDRTPLYVVATGSARVCVVSEYAIAMVLADKLNVKVYAVWRDSYAVWHVVEQ